MPNHAFDAIVVGSGPNGFASAITLQMAGLKVLLVEGRPTTGGGMRSGEYTLPGFIHDHCSTVHPMAVHSPFFQALPLEKFGLRYCFPPISAAHPFDDGSSAFLTQDIGASAGSLGKDGPAYQKLMEPLVAEWPGIEAEFLGPFHWPRRLGPASRFAFKALLPASRFVRKYFKGSMAAGLFAGMAAHGMLPLSMPTSSAAGLVLLMQGHRKGWPVIEGGTQRLAQALEGLFKSLGGEVHTDFFVKSLEDLPTARAVILDLTPRQVLKIAGPRFSALYRYQLRNYKYGMGIFKMDWALDGPIPFRSEACRKAGTVHLGGTFEQIAGEESKIFKGTASHSPFVLLAQQSVADPSRAPEGKQTAWAYCHVPHGSTENFQKIIEQQVERFAPGFRDRILASKITSPAMLEADNPNYVGGDINGGILNLRQLFTRPSLKLVPYRTSARDIYLCSSSTPPGGGVHGMCGYQAARTVLRDIFHLPDPLGHGHFR